MSSKSKTKKTAKSKTTAPWEKHGVSIRCYRALVRLYREKHGMERRGRFGEEAATLEKFLKTELAKMEKTEAGKRGAWRTTVLQRCKSPMKSLIKAGAAPMKVKLSKAKPPTKSSKPSGKTKSAPKAKAAKKPSAKPSATVPTGDENPKGADDAAMQ